MKPSVPVFQSARVDIALAATLCGAIATALLATAHSLQFESVRGGFYGTVAALAGSLLGFVLAAVTIVASSLGQRSVARIARSSELPKMWSLFLSTSHWLGITCVLAIVALVVDNGAVNLWPLSWLVVVSGVVAALRVLRCIRSVDLMLGILSQDKSRPANET